MLAAALAVARPSVFRSSCAACSLAWARTRAFLAHEEVPSSEGSRVVGHMHCVHGSDEARQPEPPKDPLAALDFDQGIKSHS